MINANYFVRILKNINKSINSLLEKNLNRLKINNLINLGRSNKIFLTIVASIILFLTYISLPNLFNKNEISKELNENLSTKLSIKFNYPNKLNYKFFPRPHFVSNDSHIVFNQNKIAKVKKMKILLTFENLFSLKKMRIKEVVLEEVNFDLNKKNYNFFEKILDNNFDGIKLKINNSKVFFRNIENEVLFINTISLMEYFYDLNELKNILYSENKLFNLPYSIKIYNDKEKEKIYSKLNIDFLKLQVENNFSYKNNIKSGSAEFMFKKLKSFSEYRINKNFLEFDFYDKNDDPKFLYNGKINFRPFYSLFEGKSNELNLSYLLSSDALFAQLLKTEILNSKNLDLKINIKASKVKNYNNLVNLFLNFKIQEGLIDFDNTKFAWKNNAAFKLSDSLIYVKDGQLVLDGILKIDILDHIKIYKFLLTPKNLRKKINQIHLNFTYNFDLKIINLKDIKIDDQINKNVNEVINNISLKNDDLQNKIYLKKLLNEAIKSYAG